MKTAVSTLACIAASILGAWSQPLPFDPTPLEDAAQDCAGRVWAIGEELGLLRWNGERWEHQELVLPGISTNAPSAATRLPEARPLLLQTNQQGVVHILWSRSGLYPHTEDDYWLTRIDGTNAPASVGFRAALQSVSLTFDPDGTGWLAGRQPEVYLIQPDLKIAPAFTATTNQMAGWRFDILNPIRILSGPSGLSRCWGEQKSRELATLRGLFLAYGTNFTAHPTLAGMPDRGFSCLVSVGPGQLWAGVPEWDKAAGLYALDLEQGRATRMAEPEPGAFAWVIGIYPAGADRYVVSNDRSGHGSLWRWRLGQWEKILPAGSFLSTEGLLFTDRRSAWFGISGRGIVRIPSSPAGPSEVYDWRHGLPLENVHRILPLPNRELLLVGFREGTTHARAEDLARGGLISPRLVDVWDSTGNLQRDARGHLWTIQSQAGQGNVLSQWDGAQWTSHTLPEHVRKGELNYPLGRDSKGRLWVVYRERQWIAEKKELRLTEKADLFDPSTDTWLHHDSLEEALADLVATQPAATVNLPGENRPDFNGRGQVCYLAMDWAERDRRIHFFDGQRWRQWDPAAAGFVRPGYLGQPYFTREGQLAINFTRQLRRGQTAVFDGSEWKPTPFRSSGPRDPMDLRPMSDFVHGERQPAQRDPAATGSWQAAGQQLVRFVSGISVPEFDLAHVHPFIGARRVDQVWVDAKGNFVVRTSMPPGTLWQRRYVVVAPPEILSGSRFGLVKTGNDGVELRLDPASSVGDGSPSRGPGFTAVEIQDGQMILHWSGGGILEVSEQAEGPWREVPDSASPFTVSTAKPSEFYRIRR